MPQENYMAHWIIERLDMFILLCFITETILKWLDCFRSYWLDAWNVFDFVITLLVVIPEMVSLLANDSFDSTCVLLCQGKSDTNCKTCFLGLQCNKASQTTQSASRVTFIQNGIKVWALKSNCGDVIRNFQFDWKHHASTTTTDVHLWGGRMQYF